MKQINLATNGFELVNKHTLKRTFLDEISLLVWVLPRPPPLPPPPSTFAPKLAVVAPETVRQLEGHLLNSLGAAKWFLFILFLVQSSSAVSQTVPDAGSLRQQIERDRSPILPSLISPKISAEPDVMRPPGDATLVVKAFHFTGNTLFSADQLSAVVRAYLNRPIKFTDLQAAAASIAEVYRQAGWVVRVVLPDQDIQDGIVTIQILQAIFGGVKPEGLASARIKTDQLLGIVGAQQQKGALLNVNNIDRALLIAGDLPGVTVTGSLRQGEYEGETELAINVADKSVFTGDFALDNTGSRSTGSSRQALNLGLASPLGLGEQINLNASHTEGSVYYRVDLTLPLGHGGWRLGVNTSRLDYKVVSPDLLALNVKGSSDSVGLEASYPLIRTLLRNLYFTAHYDRKRFNNLALGAVTSRYKADALALQLYGNVLDGAGGGGTNNAILSLVNGDINLDGSPNQLADALTTQTAGSFTKLRYALSRQQAVSGEISVFASLSGQYARKNLDSSEKFSLGGTSGVRAYPAGEGSGALANLVNIELRWRLPQGFDLTGFYDFGRIHINPSNSFAGAAVLNRMSLQGAGLALAWSSTKGATLKATLARRTLNNPNPTDTGKDQDGSLVKNRLWVAANLPF